MWWQTDCPKFYWCSINIVKVVQWYTVVLSDIRFFLSSPDRLMESDTHEPTVQISRMHLKVKVIGQRSRSLDWKTGFSRFRWVDLCRFTLSWHMKSCDIMARRHDVTWCYGMTSLEVFGREYWQRGHDAGGHFNAQTFLYWWALDQI